jgi:hypothetical protein
VSRARSPFLTTYAAVLVLAALGGYAYFVESKKPAAGEKHKDKALALDKDKVKELTLTPASGDAIHLVKADKDWRMASPLVVAADSAEVEALLSSLQSLEIDEVVVPSAPKLEDFGLAPAKLKVSVVQTGAPNPQELLLGDKTPSGGGLYAKLPAEPKVFTIPGYVESSLMKKPFDLRDRDLLHVKRDAVKAVEVVGPQGSFTLNRGSGEEFSFSKPLQTKAGRWSVDGLLSNLEGLKMDGIAADNPKDLKPFGLVKPTWHVTLSLNDGTSKTLEVGGSPSDKKYFAREASGTLVAIITSPVVDELSKGMGELRAKRLLELATYEVEGFTVLAGGKSQEYERSSSKSKDGFDAYKWKRAKPDSKDIETSKIEDVLFKLGGLEVKEFLDKPEAPEKYGLDAPTLKVTIRLGAGKPPVSVEIGEKDGAFYGRRPGDDSILKLDPAKAGEVLKNFKDV